MPRTVQIAPSLLSADFLNLQRDVELMATASQQPEWLHIDVMDGHFVPNLTIGPVFVKSLKKITNIKLDVHLMIDNPVTQVDWYLEAGTDLLVVHVESFGAGAAPAPTPLSTSDPSSDPLSDPLSVPGNNGVTASDGAIAGSSSPVLGKGTSFAISALAPSQVDELKALLECIRATGALAGVALNPNTPLEVLEPLYGCFDLVLIMSVHPGFAAQSFIPASLDRLESLVEERLKSIKKYGTEKGNFLIEVDGGINLETAARAATAGADILVAGNAIFGADDPLQAFVQIRQRANAAIADAAGR